VFTIEPSGMTLVELAPGVGLEEVQAKTEASYRVARGLG
jgi:acyl CoA:acetate/3-ketoacid CoA transferase beta subunit